MARYYVPIVLNTADKQHAPLSVGAFLDPRFIPVSMQNGNFVVNVTDGVYVGADEMISSDTGNILVAGVDNKLYVPSPKASDIIGDLVSGVPGNELTIVDGKLFVPVQPEDMQRLVSELPDNQLQVVGNKLYMPPVDTRMRVSAEDGNLLHLGADRGVSVKATDILSNEAGNSLAVSIIDGRIYYKGLSITDILSDAVGQLLGLDNDGKILLTKEMLASLFGPNDGYTYGWKDGEWVRVVTDIAINPEDKILTYDSDGLLAEVNLYYDSAHGLIQLIGRGGTVISSVTLPSLQLLVDAYVEVNPVGQPAGTYLVLVLQTEEGNKNIYINLGDLVQAYTAGNAAIQVTDYKIYGVVDTAVGLAIAAGKGITFATGYSLMTDAQKNKLAGIEDNAQRNRAGKGLTLEADGSLSVVYGNTANTSVQGNDPRNSDAREPKPHAPTHAVGGSDRVTPVSIDAADRIHSTPYATVSTAGHVRPGVGLNIITGGTLSVDFGSGEGQVPSNDDPRFTDAREPLPHADTHAAGGSDELTPDMIDALHVDGTAKAAEKLATPRRITLAGDVTGSALFDGTGDIIIPCVVLNTGAAYITEWKCFMERTEPVGWKERNGQWLDNAEEDYPLLWAALHTSANAWKVVTPERWIELQNKYGIAAEGGDLIGGVANFAIDEAGKRIRLPDTRGMHGEHCGALYDNLENVTFQPGDTHKDMQPRVTGAVDQAARVDPVYTTRGSGAFTKTITSSVAPVPSGSGAGTGALHIEFDNADVLPADNINLRVAPASYGLLCCVYVGDNQGTNYVLTLTTDKSTIAVGEAATLTAQLSEV